MESLLLGSTLVARAIVGGVFLRAGVGKLRGRAAFRLALERDHRLPRPAAFAAAWLLPPGEVGLGAALLLGWWTTVATAGTLVLLVAFTAALAATRAGGNAAPCGCFGGTRGAVGWEAPRRNVGLLLLGGLILAAPRLPLTLERALISGGPAEGALAGLAPGMACALLAVGAWIMIGEALDMRVRGRRPVRAAGIARGRHGH